MANEQNLKGRKLTSEEARRIGSKGGKASVKARRERKAMREAAIELLSMPITKPAEAKIRNKSPFSLPDERLTAEQGIVLAQLAKAFTGDTKAAEFIRDITGQKPAEKVETTVDVAKVSEQLGDMLDEFSEGDG